MSTPHGNSKDNWNGEDLRLLAELLRQANNFAARAKQEVRRVDQSRRVEIESAWREAHAKWIAIACEAVLPFDPLGTVQQAIQHPKAGLVRFAGNPVLSEIIAEMEARAEAIGREIDIRRSPTNVTQNTVNVSAGRDANVSQAIASAANSNAQAGDRSTGLIGRLDSILGALGSVF